MRNLINRLYSIQYKGREKTLSHWQSLKNIFDRPAVPQIDAKTFAPEKVLFVLTGLLGDSVMSTSAIIAARAIWKHSHFVLLGKKHNCELLSACPLIDEFYVCNADPFSLRNSDEIKDLKNWLAAQKFDAAIILLGDHSAHLLAKAKIPVRVGVKNRPLEPFATHTYDIGSPQTWGADERLNALRCLNYEIGHVKPQLWVNEAARAATREKLEKLGLKEGCSYIAIHPFGSERRKWWDLDEITELAKIIKQRYDLETVLIGGKETIPAILAKLKESVIDTAGQFNIQELTAVLDDAEVIVTTDSGPFHIAGALKKPIVGLFRERSPQLAAQYSTADVIFGDNESCRKQCGWDFCRTVPCAQLCSIRTETVVQRINNRLKRLN